MFVKRGKYISLENIISIFFNTFPTILLFQNAEFYTVLLSNVYILIMYFETIHNFLLKIDLSTRIFSEVYFYLNLFMATLQQTSRRLLFYKMMKYRSVHFR